MCRCVLQQPQPGQSAKQAQPQQQPAKPSQAQHSSSSRTAHSFHPSADLLPTLVYSAVYEQEQSPNGFHLDAIEVDVAKGALYDNGLLQSGGRLSRVNQLVSLNGYGASSALRGLSLATGWQLSDVHTQVTHAVPDCNSEQEQRNAVADRGRIVWRGAVKVPRGADNTTAAQLCRSLLLSDGARVDIQPCLEIDTDDVVCTHGATVSDLDDEVRTARTATTAHTYLRISTPLTSPSLCVPSCCCR